jgi:hypothetical protein
MTPNVKTLTSPTAAGAKAKDQWKPLLEEKYAGQGNNPGG